MSFVINTFSLFSINQTEFLKTAWILDLGLNIYLYNDLNRF